MLQPRNLKIKSLWQRNFSQIERMMVQILKLPIDIKLYTVVVRFLPPHIIYAKIILVDRNVIFAKPNSLVKD